MGLTAYEYQCGHGVTIGEASARKLGEAARQEGIALSLHAPYYISLSSPEEEKRRNSVGYLLKAATAAHWMGAGRVVVHAGSCGKISREEALALAKDTLKQGLEALDQAGLSHIRVCPEVMGKLNQLGTLEEVLELCGIDERLLPCVDFGHLNARTQGWLGTPGAVKQVFDQLENRLGRERASGSMCTSPKSVYRRRGKTASHLCGPGIWPRF